MTAGTEALLSSWLKPDAIFRGAPFWSWNGLLEPARLMRQIKAMQAAGMGGFFMHSRYGLKTPYLSDEWFACVTACVEKARALGMKAYLYDEDRWPSGTAGGAVTRENPDFGIHYLFASFGEELVCGRKARDVQPAGAFAVRTGEGEPFAFRRLAPGESLHTGEVKMQFATGYDAPGSGNYNDGTYISVLNKDAVADFLRKNYDVYAQRYGADFGGLIPAIFTDEPQFCGFSDKAGQWSFFPWSPRLPQEFLRRHGYDLRDHLPELMNQVEGRFSPVCHDYRRTITELFVEAFSKQIGQWCEQHQIAFTGHYMLENYLGSQTGNIGAAMPHYVWQQWPGIDLLTDQADELFTAKGCSSVAEQFGKERVISEMYGCTGWDWPLEGHKFVGDWQYACGVNFRCHHLFHYSLQGGAKRDYPASIAPHSPWWPYYRTVEDYFARLSFMLTRGQAVRDVLVVNPIESTWGYVARPWPQEKECVSPLDTEFKAILHELAGQHHDFDLGDEGLMAEHATVEDTLLRIGRMRYKLVVVPPVTTLRSSTLELLARFVKAGGMVLFAGRQPDHVDGRPSARPLERLGGAFKVCSASPAEVAASVDKLLPRRLSITCNNGEAKQIWHMFRKSSEGHILFLQSHDRKQGCKLRLRVEGKTPVLLWDALTGERYGIPAKSSGGFAEFDLSLPPTGSALLTFGISDDTARPLPVPEAARETVRDEGPWPVELVEPNTLPLDFCTFRREGEKWSDVMPSLRADRLIRESCGLEPRAGGAHQPWYLYGTGRVDLTPRGRMEIRRVFHVTARPAGCRLAIERPEDFDVLVNGQPVGAPDSWWVDEDIKTIDITALLKEGENEILQRFNYRPDMEIEDIYLAGDFGVVFRDGKRTAESATLTAPVRELRAGSWVGQGLPFYGGAVRYRVRCGQAGKAVRIRLPGVMCTAAAIHADGKTAVLPWAPFEAEMTVPADGKVEAEVIGGRKNILGPLHLPWKAWTGPGEFSPDHPEFADEYLLTDHGVTSVEWTDTITF